jgi:hypothetical protein
MAGPREYTQKTIKRLFGRSGNQCAFPGCNKIMTNDKNAKDSNICHIEAANEGGERYNPNMSNAKRADYLNLILLCEQHHDETDDFDKYTVDVLKEMKANHEAEIAKKLNPNLNHSILTTVINTISNIDIDEFESSEVKNAFNAEDKIKYNCVRRNKLIIEEYRIYQGKLNAIFAELEELGSVKKNNLLRNIKQLYISAKSELLADDQSIENVRQHADDLIDSVENKLCNIIEDSSNKIELLDIETLTFGVKIVLVDAFLRCNILEEVVQ